MPEILQNILIILLSMWALIDNRGITVVNHWPITVGFFAGLIMGDLTTAMTIAGTFQLMSLGVAALGGSSVPDYALATVVAIFLNARTGADIGTSIAVGLPVGILAINLDIFTRTLNSFVVEKSKALLEEGKFEASQNIHWISMFFVAMQGFIPMIILVLFGEAAVNTIIEVIPEWFTNGLNIAGGMLPVVGVAMLLRYMPSKRYFWAIIIGFVFSAYLKLPILGISLIGLSMAMVVFSKLTKENKALTTTENFTIEGDDFDE
ncbi:PTS mannose/fructose/sorbose/N-acetylgalactosamine transporter subunit IIC [Streptococcus pluranimalium]|uniref:PTS mannose/fructose/sorbose/N-acetylgalactosamine transporter subunit IIC n=1 Tax=Streptococcus pluranimalium TaxID=82348 RepID=UPI003F691C36